MIEDEKLLNNSEAYNNNNERNKLLNNLLNNSKIIRSFSVPKTNVINLVNFIEISSREDPNFSVTINKAIAEYVRHHQIPNPQMTLSRSLGLGLPAKPRDRCCVGKCRAKARYLKTMRNYEGRDEVFQLCHQHRNWSHPDFKYVIRVKPVYG